MFAKTAASIALATAVLAASPAAVFAAAPTSVQVRLGDLDLATDAGRATLMTRVRQAASTVCGGDQPHPSLDEMRTYMSCRAKAAAGVTPQLNVAIAAAEHPEQYAMVRRANSQSAAD